MGAAGFAALCPVLLLQRRHPRGQRAADHVQRRGLDGALLRQVHERSVGLRMKPFIAASAATTEREERA